MKMFGFTNMYKFDNGEIQFSQIYDTKEKAESKIIHGPAYLTTIKIDWEDNKI